MLLSQYVCARITRMDDVDIGLFEYDRNNTLYYFIMNADEHIYMRYGGRDSQSQDSYLNLASIELAMQQGLELHRQYQRGELKKSERPKPMFPREFPMLVERTFARSACVECHLIGDFQNLHREQDGTLDKLQHMFRSPDIKTIGIHLDVPKGLLVKEARDAVAAAGMKAGDRIIHLNGTPVWTFGDLQYHYDKVPRSASRVEITVDRNGQAVPLSVALPVRWWLTEIRWRQFSVDPRVYFDSDPLTEAEKAKHQLKAKGFASSVKHVDMFAEVVKSHELKVNDIIYAVDGVEEDEHAHTAELYIKLRRKPGDAVTLDVIRDGKRIKMPLRTYKVSFRK
jgi:hypothetical protein